ncbi:PREDICTED: limulus clotting factor C-like isoform X2 [Acromyrmex echinatior]|uniref:limulus clotting factor C-like isoform X2 n=1 Tax=Acromyrmex echinatior TaxID=103372 RepID=UPI000580C99B|nr:PREDICTED: limulus clotting factor C-like isoform X2 [Acromyrmex echinatior]
MPVTNACVVFSVTLSFLALLPSLPLQARAQILDYGFSDRYGTTASNGPPGHSKWSGNTNLSGPPGHNKWGGGGKGSSGGRGPPGLGGGGPPGLIGKRPPGWNKVDTENSSEGENYPRPNSNENYPRPNNDENYSRPSNNENYPRPNNDANHPRPNNNENYPSSNNSGSIQRPYPDYNREGPHGPGDRISDRNEYPQNRQCRDDEFRCGSNECLPRRVKCDNKNDCRDSSDEEFCMANRNNDDSCVLPQQPEGGHYELGGCDERCDKRPGDTVPKNSFLNYTCKSNYMLKGNTISVCVNNRWYQPPSCHKICSPLNSTSVDISCSYHGKTVSCSERILPGTQATLACKSSYKLPLTNDPAYRELTCLDDGLWDRRLFRCLPECGTSIAHGNTLIVNGFAARTGIFPWHVGIYAKENTDRYQQICGGTLINNNLVISAAHCFYDEVYNKLYNESQYAVAAGKHYRDWNAREKYAQKSLVESIQAGGRYQGARGNFANDIALLKLKTPFELTTLVRPVCVDWDNTHEREQLQVGHSGKVVGWGKDIKGESTKSLQEIDMPFVPYDQCLSVVPQDFRGYLTSDKFCAGHLNGSSVCDGDSGGGLCFEKDGIWYLRGIVSVSPENKGTCDYNSYVGFTSISHFRDWIREAYVNA